MDFFADAACTEPAVSYRIFGLIDMQNAKQPAFSTISDAENWEATIKNDNQELIQFIGIDRNPYFKTFKAEQKCDGMLYYKNNKNRAVIFVELKSGLNTTKWVYKAKLQLMHTITRFSECHAISDFKERKAFAANNRDANVAVVRQNDIEDFFELGFDFYTQPIITM